MIFSLCLLTITLFLSKVTMHSLSHSFPIDMRLEWSLGNISACFDWLANFEVESGIGEWIPLLMNWGVSH